MARAARYVTEIDQARRMACQPSDFLKLLSATALFHLGNKLSLFNSNRQRRIRCLCNRKCLTIEFRQNTGDVAVLHEIFGAKIYRAPYESLERVNTIVDLGAHIGLATLYFATLFPEARLISVEPMPDNFALLERNCLFNSIYPTLVNKCVGSRTEEVDLRRNASSHMHSVIRRDSEVDQDSIRVEMLAMADLLAKNTVSEIDILKVDIEGAEQELFAACDAWIAKVRLIIIEVHPGIVDYQRVIRSITTHGFEYFPPGTFAPDYDVFLRGDVASEAARRGYASK